MVFFQNLNDQLAVPTIQDGDRVSGDPIDLLEQVRKKWENTPVERACVIHRATVLGGWVVQEFIPGNRSSVHFDQKALAKEILRLESDALILAHLHPNGPARPSLQDKCATRTAANLCRALNVTLIDHIIFAPNDLFSFRHTGYL